MIPNRAGAGDSLNEDLHDAIFDGDSDDVEVLLKRGDEVVAHYATWSEYRAQGESYAPVAGLDEDTAIRRLGLDPADCPITDGGGYCHALPGVGYEAYWLGTPPGGSGVALLNLVGTWPGSGHMWGHSVCLGWWWRSPPMRTSTRASRSGVTAATPGSSSLSGP